MRTSTPFLQRLAVLVALLTTMAATAAVAQSANPWLDRGIVNIAHRGGANEGPENTPMAYAKALRTGSEMLEMDIYESADGELIVLHDSTIDRTTDGSGDVSSFTVDELKAFDAAYWFVPGRGTVRDADDAEYTYRGIATGQRPVPAELAALGVVADDFRIPTLRQILERHPDDLLLIELKPDEGSTGSYEKKLADLLAEFGRTTDVLVASFLDQHLRLFKTFAPDVSTSPATAEVAASWTTGQQMGPGLTAGHAAFSVPPALGVTVVTQDFVDDAHANGVAVYVWTINDCDEMVRLLHLDIDGIMSDSPAIFEALLQQPTGAWDCAALDAAPTPTEPDPAPAPVSDPVPLPATGGGIAAAGLVALLAARTTRRRT